MRLIDSNEVKETARRIAKIPWGDDRGHKVEMRWTLEELERLIDTAPTIEAVEVVRCKDCKHRYKLECPMYHQEWFTIDEGDGWCDSDFCIIDETQDDGFCYCGEREELR